jgi:Bacterial protein of unknown function (DUF885)
MTPLEQCVSEYLSLHAEFHPVDASFMGLDGHDHRLPPADPQAFEREAAWLKRLEHQAKQLQPSTSDHARLEAKMLTSQLRVKLRELEERPRYHNPSWYTGEAAFGLISLLLPANPARRSDDLRQRLEDIPRFLSEGSQRLLQQAIPSDWVIRAQQECKALTTLLNHGLPKHPLWTASFEQIARDAVMAVQGFASSLDGHPDLDPACGEAYLSFLMREAHGLTFSPLEAETLALEGFEQSKHDLENMAARLGAHQDWRTQLASLEHDHPSLEAIIPTYQRWHQTALEAAESAGLLTPATDYALDFQALPTWAHEVAAELYFLFYRSPAAGRPAKGSVYWVFPPASNQAAYLRSQNNSTIKITHVVHHGSIGHHTQNAKARASKVRLGQLAGTDCASGIAMLGAGTLIEGWACYSQDLMLEVEGFYTPLEALLLKHHELRNAAMCLADIRVHRGFWSLDQMRDFYQHEVGVAATRVWSESTRNSIYPASRLMYWLGTRAIKQLRQNHNLETRDFHDALLQFGSVPINLVADLLKQNASNP